MNPSAILKQAVIDLGLAGRSVCIHSSMSAFGDKAYSPDLIIDTFLSADCTIMCPTFTYGFTCRPPEALRPRQNGCDYGNLDEWDELLDVHYSQRGNTLSKAGMGMFPASILERTGRLRGAHPINSFTAIGPKAEQLIAPQSWIDVYAPFRALAEENGAVLLIGVDLTKMTLIHAAEVMAGRKPFIRWAKNASDNVQVAVTGGGCSGGFGKLEGTLSPLRQETRVGGVHLGYLSGGRDDGCGQGRYPEGRSDHSLLQPYLRTMS